MSAKQTTASLREGRAKKRQGRDFGKGTGKVFTKVHDGDVLQPVNGGLTPPAKKNGKKITQVAVDAILPDDDAPPRSESPFKDWIFLGDFGGEKWGLTEVKLQEALEILRDGGSRGDAADIVGCHRCTFNKLAEISPIWGKAMLRAEALGKLFLIRRVGRGDSNWQSAAWMLAKKHKTEYGQQDDNEDQKRTVIRVRPVGFKSPPQLPAGEANRQYLPATQASEVDGNHDHTGTSSTDNGVDSILDIDGSEIEVKRPKR